MGAGSLEFWSSEQIARAQRMIAEQLEARGINNPRVLQAMRDIPRHLFVGEGQQQEAYDDRPLRIGGGQTISQPYMVAAMTQALDPAPDGRVLEVGTGSGYQAAILACLAREVVSLERLPELAERARRTLERLGLNNVTIVVGDGSDGYAPLQPYTGIIVTAGAPRIPEALTEQLADGGRLVIPVGGQMYQDLTLVTRHGDEYRVSHIGGCVFVPLIGRDAWEH